MRGAWSPENEARLREAFADTPTVAIARELRRPYTNVAQKAAKLGLRKSAAYLASPAAGRTNGRQGVGSRFVKGQVPHNKGLRRPGWAPGRMSETQFKRGQMSGAAQHNYVPIGSERLSKDGYLERKVNDTHPVPARRWVGVHRIVWEAANGPTPKGFAVCFLPGRRTAERDAITLDALELVSRRDLMLRNSYHRYPQPIPRLIQLRGALNRKINQRTRREQERN